MLRRISKLISRLFHHDSSLSFPDGRVNPAKSTRTGPVQWSIGDHSYANGIHLYGWQKELSVSVGKYCSIAENVVFLAGGEHDHRAVSSSPLFYELAKKYRVNSKGNISVGHDVWIGHGAIILSGVTIGDGAVVAAGAVVTKNIPPYAIAAGVPARIIKYRFSESTIRELLEIRWWDWPDLTTRERANDFLDMELFLSKYGTTAHSAPNSEKESRLT